MCNLNGLVQIGIEAIQTDAYNQLVNGVLAILCLKFVNDGEKIIRKIFGFQDDNSSTSMAAGLTMGMAALSNAKKIGANTRKGLNKTKSLYKNALEKDFAGLATRKNAISEKLLQGRSSKSNADKPKDNKSSDKSKENIATKEKKHSGRLARIGGGAKRTITAPYRAYKGTKEKVATFKGKHENLGKIMDYVHSKNSLSNALGIMAAAMAYSSGSTSALEAVGMGTKVQQGTQEFFSSSTKNAAERAKRNIEKLAEESIQEIEAVGSQYDSANATGAIKDYSDSVKLAQEAQKKAEEIAKIQEEISKKKGNVDISELEQKRDKLAKEKVALETQSEDKKKMAEEKWEKIVIGKDKKPSKDLLQYTVDEEGNARSSKEFMESAVKETYQSVVYGASKGASKAEVDKEIEEIKRMLLDAKMKSVGVDSVYNLSSDQFENVNAIAETLMKRVKLSITPNSSPFTQEEMEKCIQKMGLQADGDNDFYKGLYQHMGNYERYMRQNDVAQEFETNRQYNGSNDTLSDIIIDDCVSKQKRRASR